MTLQLADLVDALESQDDGITQYLDLQLERFVLITEDFESHTGDEEPEADTPGGIREIMVDIRAIRDKPDHFIELPSQPDIRGGRIVRAFCEPLARNIHEGSSPVTRCAKRQCGAHWKARSRT